MARGRKPFPLGLDPASYNPQGLKAYDDKVLRKEYSRVRREAEDRLRKLGQSEFRKSRAYQENIGQFPTLKEIGSRDELERKLRQAARFVTAKASSASGQRDIRRKQLQTLHQKPGFEWVNTKNFQDFTDFMNELEARSEKGLYYELMKGYEPDEDEDEDEEEEGENPLRDAFEVWLERKQQREEYEDEDLEEWDSEEPEPEIPKTPAKRSKKKPNQKKKQSRNQKTGRKKGRRS